MPQIRLLVHVAGSGAVQGEPGDVLDVDAATAKAWADDVRAERVSSSRDGRPANVERAVAGPPEARG